MELSGQLIKGTGSYEIKEIAPISQGGEHVQNGNFEDGSTGWTTSASFTFTGGILSYLDIASTHVDNTLLHPLVNGKWYKLSFDILNATAGKLSILDAAGSAALGLPNTGLFGNTYTDGHYEYIFKCIEDASAIELNAYNTGSSWQMDNLSIVEVPEGYPLMDKGTKYLECTASGTVSFPSKQAYGEWEFSFYKGADATSIVFNFTALGPFLNAGAYRVNISAGEAVYLRATTSNILYSALSYIKIQTWYRIKVTRTLDNEFYIYIMGGDFGTDDWTLVDVTGGGGTNPVTDTAQSTSEYCFLDNDIFDRIADIVFRPAVRQ